MRPHLLQTNNNTTLSSVEEGIRKGFKSGDSGRGEEGERERERKREIKERNSSSFLGIP